MIMTFFDSVEMYDDTAPEGFWRAVEISFSPPYICVFEMRRSAPRPGASTSFLSLALLRSLSWLFHRESNLGEETCWYPSVLHFWPILSRRHVPSSIQIMTEYTTESIRWEERVQIVRKHYQDKGYRVHSGLQFGCELVLYADDPSKVHSDFCVHVVPEGKCLSNGSKHALPKNERMMSLSRFSFSY